MKKLLLAGVGAAAIVSAPVFAADLPVKAPIQKVAPYDPWTGCYLGGNVGGAWGRKETIFTNDNGFLVRESLGKTNVDGWAGGGQVGCDYRVNTTWVFGVRGMWDGADLKGTNVWPAGISSTPNMNAYKISQFGTVVATFGYLLNPTLELYGLAGIAWVRDRLSGVEVQPLPGTVFWTGTQSRAGYDVGVGIAWMFAPPWNFVIEYDHMGFGTKNFNLTGVGPDAGQIFAADVKQNVDKVLVGINYRFNTVH